MPDAMREAAELIYRSYELRDGTTDSEDREDADDLARQLLDAGLLVDPSRQLPEGCTVALTDDEARLLAELLDEIEDEGDRADLADLMCRLAAFGAEGTEAPK